MFNAMKPPIINQAPTELEALRERIHKDARDPGGTQCPVCDGHVQVYRRALTKQQVVELSRLVGLYTANQGGYYHVKDDLDVRNGGEFSLLQHWSLITPKNPGAKRAGGRWAPTQYGYEFLQGKLSLPRAGYFLHGKVLAWDASMVTVSEVHEFFDYNEMMKSPLPEGV